MNQAVAANALNAPTSPVVRLGSIDALESALIDRWADVGQATYQFLALLREFDVRQGWRAYGCNDCAEWLDFKLKISRKTALEKLRVANALWFVPKIDAAFRDGQLSYSQVRALTRIADEANEEELLNRARFELGRSSGDVRAAPAPGRCAGGRAPGAHAAPASVAARVRRVRRADCEAAAGRAGPGAAGAGGAGRRPAGGSRAGLFCELARMRWCRWRRGCFRGRRREPLTTRSPSKTATSSPPSDQPPGAAHQILVHVDAVALSGQRRGVRLPAADGQASVLLG